MTAICLGYFIDMLLGDPSGFPHPVRGIGWLIIRLEELLKPKGKNPVTQRILGAVLTVITITVTVLVTWAILHFATRIHPFLGLAFNVLIAYMVLATNCLGSEAEQVRLFLKRGDLEGARKQVSMLVSRDTEHLDESGVARAAVETVAENFSDGVVAPLFWLVIGGAPLAMAYKAVNTLDSMVGYKNEDYFYFGWFSARLDDWVNWIPARFSALFVILGAGIMNMHPRRSLEIVKRDHGNHSSPNSGWPESAFAGALGIQMGGKSRYFGMETLKPTIGDPIEPIVAETIRKTTGLMYVSSLCALALLVGAYGLIVHGLLSK